MSKYKPHLRQTNPFVSALQLFSLSEAFLLTVSLNWMLQEMMILSFV